MSFLNWLPLIVLAECSVWPSNEAVPFFIGETIRERLEFGLARRREILSMSTEDLSQIELEENEDVLLSIDLDEAEPPFEVFMGVPDVSVDEFPDTWKDISMMSRLDSPATDECLMIIWMFYIRRPVWFSASHEDIESLRECIGHGLLLIHAAGNAPEPAQVLATTIASLLPVAFNAKAELKVRLRPSTLQFLRGGNQVFFGRYMREHPRLMALLNEQAESSGEADDLELTEARFAAWIGNGRFRHEHHAADFIDFHWARLSLVGDASKSLRLWKRLCQVNDEQILRFETQKQSLLNDPFVHLRFKVNLDRGHSPLAWILSVGGLIDALIQTNGMAVLRDSSLPTAVTVSDVHSSLIASPHLIPTFYQEILERIESCAYTLPREDVANHVATLMHMARIGTSPAAFVVSS
jgi:hypothetical protein